MKKYTKVSMVGWMGLERNQRQPEVRIPRTTPAAPRTVKWFDHHNHRLHKTAGCIFQIKNKYIVTVYIF
jgi:hypothetical protein